jgi:hypothetical protein
MMIIAERRVSLSGPPPRNELPTVVTPTAHGLCGEVGVQVGQKSGRR